MGVKIDASKAIKQMSAQLSDLQKKQVPFATAATLTTLAKMAQANEKEELPSIFDRPTPFTINSVAVTPATKSNLTAVVFYKDVAAQYLEPFEDGGDHFLGGKQAMLTPVGQKVNQYGNLPRTTTARLRGKPNVFTGKVVTKNGVTISGVWQRIAASKGKPGGLKLLIEFNDPEPVKQSLGFEDRVTKLVAENLHPVFNAAMAKALDTAR